MRISPPTSSPDHYIKQFEEIFAGKPFIHLYRLYRYRTLRTRGFVNRSWDRNSIDPDFVSRKTKFLDKNPKKLPDSRLELWYYLSFDDKGENHSYRHLKNNFIRFLQSITPIFAYLQLPLPLLLLIVSWKFPHSYCHFLS